MPRKTAAAVLRGVRGAGASMRPRPDAAENMVDAGRMDAVPNAASMRPRPDAAENPVARPASRHGNGLQ